MFHLYSVAGGLAATRFRREQLLSTISQISPNITDILARHVHWIQSSVALTDQELSKLNSLLLATEQPAPSDKGILVLVTPRLGTISPWASKATDIAHNCGLSVKRIERVTEYRLMLKKPLLSSAKLEASDLQKIVDVLHDRMTESVFFEYDDAKRLFDEKQSSPMHTIDVLREGIDALERANAELGLAISSDEMSYLVNAFQAVNRNPTDVELMMFAQANSEHCRHKIFNADFMINGKAQARSLFGMIRNTHKTYPAHTIVAYSDNAAIIEGGPMEQFAAPYAENSSHGGAIYQKKTVQGHMIIKVETHNHPTAIAPYPGASTGVGGEIRDEGATGRGARPKAGLTGFSVSKLWPVADEAYGKPAHIASPLQIMIEGPLGGAAFNNEFGRPNLCGYFREYEESVPSNKDTIQRGYHKPIMIAGGLGVIDSYQTHKLKFIEGALLIQLGGPGMRIGMGGSAASSMSSGANAAHLDFDSVQRGNPEIQRRAQEVIHQCVLMGESNPILAIHDVGAGGLSNAFPELVHDAGCGARFGLNAIPLEESGLSPKEIWCNESQERYVLAINPTALQLFQALCERERCPFAVAGHATTERRLLVAGQQTGAVVDMPMEVLLGKPPKMLRNVKSISRTVKALDLSDVTLTDVVPKVLSHPTVASKRFLITIGDRTVGGLTHRDQMVGPWQVPVADCAVTLADYAGFTGQAMAMGERTPLASSDAAASARMAVAESITNLLAAPIELSRVKLSANWMAACGQDGEDAALFEAVKAVGMELCPALGISIPVGKDSLSMRTQWQDANQKKSVVSPVSLIVSSFAQLTDVRTTLTPQLQAVDGVLVIIDLGRGKCRMAHSILAQALNQVGESVPDVDNVQDLQSLVSAINQLRQKQLILAYHDRSDGGLFTTLAEMAFAGRVSVDVIVDMLLIENDAIHDSRMDVGDSKNWVDQISGRRSEQTLKALFNEELAVVIQVNAKDRDAVMDVLRHHQLSACSHVIGQTHAVARGKEATLSIWRDAKQIFTETIHHLQQMWDEVSWKICSKRDNPSCADSEHHQAGLPTDTGLFIHIPAGTQTLLNSVSPVMPYLSTRPRVAILREQGVNSHVEMAYCFDMAGFEAVDVHMTDLRSKRIDLSTFNGLVACGGFSYGDTLGAGVGWARSILLNTQLLETFSQFFARPHVFGLGVCNGCQMFAELSAIIPGAGDWPRFTTNQSERYEARLAMVEVISSPSLFLQGMTGCQLPIAVAHGEGFANFTHQGNAQAVLAAMRFVDNRGQVTTTYPANPNGSSQGLTGVTTADGRFTAMMPHPERGFRNVQMSWTPQNSSDISPWAQLWRNARKWVG